MTPELSEEIEALIAFHEYEAKSASLDAEQHRHRHPDLAARHTRKADNAVRTMDALRSLSARNRAMREALEGLRRAVKSSGAASGPDPFMLSEALVLAEAALSEQTTKPVETT